MTDRLPVAHDEYGSEIDDLRDIPKDEIKMMLADMLGEQVSAVSYEPETGCFLVSIGHVITLRCGAAHIRAPHNQNTCSH